MMAQRSKFNTVLAVLAVLTLGASAANAVVLGEDDFESYTVGSSLNGGAGGAGWTGNWNAIAGSTVQADSLSAAGVNGGAQAVLLNANSNSAASRAIAAQTGTFYVSFLVRADSLEGGDFVNFMVSDGAIGNDPAALGVGIRNNAGNPFFARSGNSGDTTVNASTLAADGQDFFLVAKYSKDGSANYNRADLFINPGSVEPILADATAINNSPGISQIDLFTIRTVGLDGDDTVTFDQLRIASTFAEALPPAVVPEPTTAVLGLMGIAGLVMRRRKIA